MESTLGNLQQGLQVVSLCNNGSYAQDVNNISTISSVVITNILYRCILSQQVLILIPRSVTQGVCHIGQIRGDGSITLSGGVDLRTRAERANKLGRPNGRHQHLDINKQCQQFYSKLYLAEEGLCNDARDHFYSGLSLEAVISVIPKPGKDLGLSRNYRPISLINCGTKIFIKALDMQLDKVLSHIIQINQVGFLHNRHSSDNLHHLIDIISMLRDSKEPLAVISFAAKKAFEHIAWDYLFHVLAKFGFDKQCIVWIKLLCSITVFRVVTNGTISAPCPLLRGKWQGCPLSPPLFNLTLEPTAIATKAIQHIHGIKVVKQMLCADDALVDVSKPKVTVPNPRSLTNMPTKAFSRIGISNDSPLI
uniref:Reverse transcriptase domain-containing protein n=1 Tax=Chrysemys picta bellii TaxID=8478 RepID=A0A8C3HXY6_CHRPI